MLKSSRHPYQTTTFPQTSHPARNPWIEKVETSTNSSCGSRSGRTAKSTIPHPASEWLVTGNQTLSHMGPLLNQQVHPIIVPAQCSGSAISVTHGSSGGGSTSGRIGSCGGQCVACETFCYYCLQVIFIAGILTGIALTIAGSVLRESQREGDLVVLLYIGVLLVLVCLLLLSVHCCVRRNVNKRKRALRMTLMDGARRDFAAIPAQEYAVDPSTGGYYTETELNDFEHRENIVPNVNIITNATYYQNRVPGIRSSIHSYERCSHRPDMPYSVVKNSQIGNNRLLR